jgi:hypothetical protein
MPDDQSSEPAEEPKPGWLPLPLPRLQAIVGVAAGALTIIVTGGSLLGFNTYYRAPVQGEIVASVSAARSRTPLRDATVEILTPASAVVTTLSADGEGRIRHRVREGQYRLRVTHPEFLPDQKDVQVWAGQRADIRVTLASRPPAPKPVASAPKRAEDGVKKLLGKLGL